MMGVSPVTMDAVTSGYNIATALTLDKHFNEMLDFIDEEVRHIICYYNEPGAFSLDDDETIYGVCNSSSPPSSCPSVAEAY